LADLFTLTVPLLIRYPDATRHVMVGSFQHPEGVVYVRPFWDRLPAGEGIRLVTGEIKGEGPWKVGAAVISVLGCQDTHPVQAAEFADWKFHLEQRGEPYPTRDELRAIAQQQGILP
jgi:hypothetical protein